MELPAWADLLKIAPIASIVMVISWGSVWVYRRYHHEDRTREKDK